MLFQAYNQGFKQHYSGQIMSCCETKSMGQEEFAKREFLLISFYLMCFITLDPVDETPKIP